MADFKELIATITGAVDKFNSNIPTIQQKMLQDVLALTRELDVKDGKIRVAASNMRVLAKLRMKLQSVLLNAGYAKSVREYVTAFDKVTGLQNQYFSSVEDSFRAPKIAKEVKKQAVTSVVNALTENGLNANIVDKVHDILRKASTTGGSVAGLSKQLTDFITTNETGEGQLLKYTKQITTDALNQYSGQYTQIISADLGFEWYRYSGSNLETSRPFCLACTDRKFFHVSELPKVLRGDFPEFVKYDGKINTKTELPEGMIPGTDESNFMVNRGGYNCGHQWRPVSDDLVPDNLKNAVYATPEYHAWALAHGKKVPQLKPEAKKLEEPKKTPDVTLVDLVPAVRNSSGELTENPGGQRVKDAVLTKNERPLKDLTDLGFKVDQDLFSHLGDAITIVASSAKTNKGKAFYVDGKVTIGDLGSRMRSPYFRETLVAHEVGHAIHNTRGIIVQSKVRPDFAEHFENLKAIIAGNEAAIENTIRGQLYNATADQGEQLMVMFDILGSLTRGAYGKGHPDWYYKTPGKSEAEVFAHSISLLKRANAFESVTPEMTAVVSAMKAYILKVL